MRRVLTRAQLREARRAETLKKVVQAQPEAPRGLLAAFKKEAHRQAVATWDRARSAAAGLAQEARQLVERLRDVARPERVKAWAQALVGRTWPQGAVSPRQQRPAETEPAAEDRRQPVPRTLPAELEREAASVPGLLEQSKTHPLTLPEKQQLVRGLNGMAGLIDEGYRVATPQFRQSVEVARQHADRQVAADMFLHLPRAEALRHHPSLASHYAVLQAIDRHGEAQQQTTQQRAQELEQAKQRMAAAIERGNAVQFRSGRLEVSNRRGVLSTEVIPQEQASERRREPPEQSQGRSR